MDIRCKYCKNFNITKQYITMDGVDDFIEGHCRKWGDPCMYEPISDTSTLEYIKEYCHYDYEREEIDKAINSIKTLDKVLKDIEDLKKSPWFNSGKPQRENGKCDIVTSISYAARKEALEVIEDLCIKNNIGKAAE